MTDKIIVGATPKIITSLPRGQRKDLMIFLWEKQINNPGYFEVNITKLMEVIQTDSRNSLAYCLNFIKQKGLINYECIGSKSYRFKLNESLVPVPKIIGNEVEKTEEVITKPRKPNAEKVPEYVTKLMENNKKLDYQDASDVQIDRIQLVDSKILECDSKIAKLRIQVNRAQRKLDNHLYAHTEYISEERWFENWKDFLEEFHKKDLECKQLSTYRELLVELQSKVSE